MNDTHTHVKQSVMERIRKGGVTMRPRWHFILLSTLSAVGILAFALFLLYVTSLVLFFLRQSGALYLGDFGGRGWYDLLRSLPLPILFLLLVFVIVLEVLVRRYALVYKKPLLASVFAILAIVLLGGYALERSPLHGTLAGLARLRLLPQPVEGLYRPPFLMRADDVYRGVIIATSTGGFVIMDHGHGTTTVRLTPRTRLPEGEDFAAGDSVVVIGDSVGTDTVQAFGAREVEAEAGGAEEMK